MSPAEVERPLMVGVTGTHSTGKTTFLARLAHELRRGHIAVATVADLGEKARRLGVPLLFNHTWASTLWFITRGISDELEAWQHADVVLVDRAVPDALGYYNAALDYRGEQPDPGQLGRLEALVRWHSTNYSLLYRTTLDPAIPLGDRARDTNTQFRELADQHIGYVLRKLDIPHQRLAAANHDTALTEAAELLITQLAEE